MNRVPDVIREEAAAWFARRRDGACSEEEAFEAWHRRSNSHAHAYAETERMWGQWNELKSSVRMREMAAAAMNGTTPRQWHPTGRLWRPLLGAACLLVIAISGDIRPLRLMAHAQSVTYSTGLGEQRTAQLPDGTRIILNTQTELEVQYGSRRREVTLKHGEAMFEVVHDARHPFVVVAADGSVTDLGTQFLVRDSGGEARVTLLQGRVEVAAQGERKQLAPGDQACYGAGVAGIRVRQVDQNAVSSWIYGRLDFRDLPLARVVAEANRYSAVKLRLGDPRLADLPVGASLRIGDTVGFAAALTTVFPLRVARRDAHEIVLMSR